jgi:hypothetical protein
VREFRRGGSGQASEFTFAVSVNLGVHVGWEKATDEPISTDLGEREPTNRCQWILTISKIGYEVSYTI